MTSDSGKTCGYCKEPATTALPFRDRTKDVCARCHRRSINGIRNLTVVSGEPFDWEVGKEMTNRVIRSDGSVNWGAAMAADPGCVSCPACGVHHWREGDVVRCSMPDCLHEWRLE
jgi:hypothetical protein